MRFLFAFLAVLAFASVAHASLPSDAAITAAAPAPAEAALPNSAWGVPKTLIPGSDQHFGAIGLADLSETEATVFHDAVDAAPAAAAKARFAKIKASLETKTEGKVEIAQAVEHGADGLCGSYAGAQVNTIAGNQNVKYKVVKIIKDHLSDPSSYNLASTASDNTLKTETACAFSKMHDAAKKAGVTLKINSGFRTLARQNYFWHCYQCKCCNNGHLAARPGSSNHGKGLATDINQTPGVYAWLKAHGHDFGFVRTVPTENWHWEYRPGTPKAKYT